MLQIVSNTELCSFFSLQMLLKGGYHLQTCHKTQLGLLLEPLLYFKSPALPLHSTFVTVCLWFDKVYVRVSDNGTTRSHHLSTRCVSLSSTPQLLISTSAPVLWTPVCTAASYYLITSCISNYTVEPTCLVLFYSSLTGNSG